MGGRHAATTHPLRASENACEAFFCLVFSFFTLRSRARAPAIKHIEAERRRSPAAICIQIADDAAVPCTFLSIRSSIGLGEGLPTNL